MRGGGRGGERRVRVEKLADFAAGFRAMGEAGARARSRTGRLLAVAQGGVEDADVVGVVDLGRDVLRPGLADDRGVVGGAHGRGDDDPTASDPAGRGAGDRRPGLGAAANRGGRPRRRDRPRGRALRRHRSEPDWWERRPRGGVPSSTRRVQCHPRDGCVAIFTQTRLALVSARGRDLQRPMRRDASNRRFWVRDARRDRRHPIPISLHRPRGEIHRNIGRKRGFETRRDDTRSGGGAGWWAVFTRSRARRRSTTRADGFFNRQPPPPYTPGSRSRGTVPPCRITWAAC